MTCIGEMEYYSFFALLFRTQPKFAQLLKKEKIMAVDITHYVAQLSGELEDNAFEASDALGRIGSPEVVEAMILLLQNPNPESRYMAARTLGLVKNNAKALVPLLKTIEDKANSSQTGDLLAVLEEFDISLHFVDIFKLYLFGSFKTSMVAKELLNFKEFDITARVLKKATKHWNHYKNNVKQDDAFDLKRHEVEEMFSDLSDYLDEPVKS